MVDKAEISLLLDYYGAFLTERRRELLRYSADEDMSLSEIAELAGVSRQSIRDSIAKGAEELLDFERKLGLARRDRQLRAAVEQLEASAELNTEAELRACIDKGLETLRSLIR